MKIRCVVLILILDMTNPPPLDELQQIMTDNGLMPFFKKGADFDAFVAKQIADIRDLSKEIGIIK